MAKTGAKHRAMYRSAVEAAKAPPGTETVVADYSKKETLAPALRGVSQVYLVCSPLPNLVELESSVIEACVEAGVKHEHFIGASFRGRQAATARNCPALHI